IMPYGCFVEIMPGKDGLLHISEIDWKRLETVEEAGIKEGDHIQVKLLEIDPKTGKYKLSHRVLIEKPEGYQERPARRERPERGERRPRPERGERPDRGDRRPRPERGERQRGGDEMSGMRRPRPEQGGDLAEKLAEKLGGESISIEEKHEPKDFSDALDHMDF
ncbi:MAG: S1 RNA-binding domain-containing protein, partial [Prevotella sp.]|nr:S1 RNA-binding domain-containing protein [Prevotella sp.]